MILTALTVEKQTVAEVAARYGVHRSTVHRLKARYNAIGEAAFEPLSRRPHTSPTAISPKVVELIRQVRIVNATTGELLRELTIDPTRDYQPTGRPPGPQPKTPK